MRQKNTWDYYSDQPYVLSKAQKQQYRQGNLFANLKLLAINMLYLPFLFVKFLLIKPTPNKINDELFYGLCVNLDKGDQQQQLVQELGIKSLQIRVYLSDIHNINDYVEFVKAFGSDKNIVINIIQHTTHINNPQLLQQDVAIIFDKFANITNEFIIGNAINRIKWGFSCVDEYLVFFQTIQQLRDQKYPNICLIGSSIIDFEYHFTIRTLFNKYQLKYDKLASLLYVDRRGAPQNKQYYIFNLKNKINFLKTIVNSSKQCGNEIYITETNYPLIDTVPYSPIGGGGFTEEYYTKYMLDYFKIAKQTGNINRVFWHQLIAPGYGLVDDRDVKIRKTVAFYAFKQMLDNA